MQERVAGWRRSSRGSLIASSKSAVAKKDCELQGETSLRGSVERRAASLMLLSATGLRFRAI